MLKFLFFAFLFFLLVRYINRLFLPSKPKNSQFNPFRGNGNRGKRNLDEIEDAEYEDLSDKNKDT